MRVLKVSKLRYLMFSISVLLIIAGIGMFFYNNGFNLGIDFNPGLSQRIQIAPEACTVSYTGDGDAVLNIRNNMLTLSITHPDATISNYSFSFEKYTTLDGLMNGIPGADGMSSIPGLMVTAVYDRKYLAPGSNGVLSTSQLAGLEYPIELTAEPSYINIINGNESEFITIDSLRETIGVLGDPQIQVIGKEYEQDFQIRIEDSGEKTDFSTATSAEIKSLLAAKFGSNRILVKQTDYVGPKFSAELGKQVAYLTSFALLLILLYIWFRFQLAYAVSAIVALIHDVTIMFGFISAFQIEVSTATIAAVLTIIGYSLNDTIVVFDRVRENLGLMRDSDFETVVNTSITQSLSRTLITSLTTLLAVFAIYIFATGSIKDFALNLIVGIIIGTYSSIFIASPILLAWINSVRRRRRKKDVQKYGIRMEKPQLSTTEEQPPTVKKEAQPVKEEKKIEVQKVDRKLKGKRQTTKKKKK